MLSTAGGAVAGRQISGKQIKNNSIASVDIKNNDVKSGDIKNRSIGGRDISSRTMASLQEIHGYEFVQNTTPVDVGIQAAISATCPHPKQMILSVQGSLENSLAPTATSIVQGTNGTARTDGTGITGPDVLRVQIICAFVS
ncbi:hypothetical protein BH11ACT8_BH11ACT8_33400 [soil metagenome]